MKVALLDPLRKLLSTARYATFSTVNEDGSPHISPMFFIPSTDLSVLYWGSHPHSLHSRNMVRTGLSYAVIIDQIDGYGRGLYFKLDNCREADTEELTGALKAHNTARRKFNKKPLELGYYQSPNPQRMYIGNIIEISTNDAERDIKGRISKDLRLVISKTDLI